MQRGVMSINMDNINNYTDKEIIMIIRHFSKHREYEILSLIASRKSHEELAIIKDNIGG